MKKTEYFMHQVAYNQLSAGLTKVKQMRDTFISDNSIEKIVDESIKTTFMAAGNQMVFVITLTYY